MVIVQQQARPPKRPRCSALVGMGVTVLILSPICIALNIVGIVLYSVAVFDLKYAGIWGSVLPLIAGILGIVGGKKAQKQADSGSST